jgi:hypothetical protein
MTGKRLDHQNHFPSFGLPYLVGAEILLESQRLGRNRSVGGACLLGRDSIASSVMEWPGMAL